MLFLNTLRKDGDALSCTPADHWCVVFSQFLELLPHILSSLCIQAVIDLSIEETSTDPHAEQIAFAHSFDHGHVLIVYMLLRKFGRHMLQ